ncbi:response regulator transcription factor [Persicimonas caeni]|uniref:Response regulator transcription factor n=1 Tax=Persicimonas caeni TaxID=2292766 RepID=A0A4Y6PZV5_PERCE|nr:response regulator transcription factor [Persicimonas caeni]QDG53856.1 response regulator transcription factor [Persicimonas caeni]QED35077.1 response regulator transcription factor [Persicimonas caeni]
MRILVIEDEPKIAGFLERGLTEEGHRVDVVEDLAQARLAAKVDEYDLLLVDRMLPDGDGLTVVREMRRRDDHTPAICLTARDRVDEKVEGLYGGADDYLVKPFEFDELLARIAAVTRRTPMGERIEVGELAIDVPARRVYRAGQEVQLTAQEFDLLRYLAEHRGQVLSRTRILDAVWDMTHDPRTNVVDVYISYLRAKIDKDFDYPLIHTVRGVGYVLEDRPR